MKFAEKLRELRKDKDLTQQKVAEATKIHINTLKNYEDLKNDYLPNAKELKAIKNYYDVSYEYLLEENCLNKSQATVNIGKELGLSDKSINFIKNLKKFECFGDIHDTNLLVDEFNYFLEDSFNFKILLLRISLVKYYNNIYKHSNNISDFAVKSVFETDSDLAVYIKGLNFKELDFYILKLSQLVASIEETYYIPDKIMQNSFDKLNTAYIDFKELIKKYDIDKDIEVIRKSLEQILKSANELALHTDEQSDLNKFRISNIMNDFLHNLN